MHREAGVSLGKKQGCFFVGFAQILCVLKKITKTCKFLRSQSYSIGRYESFFATLKKERIYRRDYVTMEEVKTDLFRYIELFYNRKRLHSVLGYMSPVEYRLKYDGGKAA